MTAVPFLPSVTRAQREAAEELLCGPLYRVSHNVFCRAATGRVVRVQSVRGLMDMGLASFNPDTLAVLPSAKLYALAERAGLIQPTPACAPQPQPMRANQKRGALP